MTLRSIRFSLWALYLLVFAGFASAQSTASAGLTSPQIGAFPLVETYLDVHTADGNFVYDLQPSQIVLREDEQPVQDLTVEEMRPGVQLVVAINPGSAIDMRNSRGLSRYDLIYEALTQWTVARQGSTIDDLSLLVTDGRQTSHLTDPQAWLEILPTALSNARQAVPSLDNLSQAVDLAADPTNRAGMSRAVLWITPPFEAGQGVALEDVAARATQQGVRLFIWLVTSVEGEISDTAPQLTDLAAQTGGQFFLFTGQETLPDLETYLEPIRSIYRITYTSQVRQSGDHQISAEIHTESETLISSPQSYSISLQAPNPAFINPPLEVTRQLPSGLNEVAAADFSIESYTPVELTLQILIDFPDQRKRGLVRTALLVDGVLVDENTSPPFDTFQWDLRSLAVSGSHSLQVVAEDVLGLSGSSMETVLEVNVQKTTNSFWVLLARNTPTLIGLAVIFSGAVALLLMVVGGRIHPRQLPVNRLRRIRISPAQPAPDRQEEQTSPAWTSRLHWPQRHVKHQAEAYLTPLSSDNVPETKTPFALTAAEITLGSDPQRATLVLDDPSVDGLHARLIKTESGAYLLSDSGSTAGTWVNYSLLPSEGACLEHNDLIHLGRSSFRFTLTHPTRLRKPVIHFLESAEKPSNPEAIQ